MRPTVTERHTSRSIHITLITLCLRKRVIMILLRIVMTQEDCKMLNSSSACDTIKTKII